MPPAHDHLPGRQVVTTVGAVAPSRRTGSYVGLTAGSAVLLVGAVVAASLLRGAFVDAHRTVGWVVACSVVALLLDPLVDALDRMLPRVMAVVVVLLAVLAVFAAVAFGVAREVVDSLDELRTEAPAAAAELEDRYDWAAEIGLTARVESFVDDIDERIRGDAVAEAAGTFPTYVVTGILMLFLLGYGRRYVDGGLNQLSPSRRRRVGAVVRTAARRGRQYLLVAVGHSLLNGLVVGSTCSLLGVPAAVMLGVAVGALTILPLIGVLVGGIPALLLAFALQGWWAGAIVGVVLVTLQTIEVAVVRPRVDPITVRVGPTVPIIVGLLGFELYGVGGAIYALAVAVIALAALDAIGHERDEADAGERGEQVVPAGAT